MPARGHYLAHEVGLLAGVPGHTIGQWARRHYIRSSQSEGRPRVYSFQDVAEAMVVHELLLEGIKHRDIKTAIQTLHDEYGDWPLTEARLGTYHGAVVAEHRGLTYDVGKLGWQQVVNPGNLAVIANRLDRGGWAVRELPDLHHVEVNPDRLSGRPAIRGRRVAARDVAEMAEPSGGGVAELKEGYELTDEQIVDARRWWKVAREYEHAVAA